MSNPESSRDEPLSESDLVRIKHLMIVDGESLPASHRYTLDSQGRVLSIWTPLNRKHDSEVEVVESPSEELVTELRAQNAVRDASLDSLVTQAIDNVAEQVKDAVILKQLGFSPEQFL